MSTSTSSASIGSATEPAKQEDSTVHSISVNAAGTKRRRTTATTTTRGVANLTPEQLEKKRANDREAQRAIRERTKLHIETLERKIEELTEQQPYQELQVALRQKELVEAENAEIRKRLSSVLDIIKPLLGGVNLGIAAAADVGANPGMD